MKRKNLFVAVTYFLLLFTASVTRVHAVNAVPSSGSYAPNSSINIVLTAAPNGSGQNAVQIRLTVTGMTITNFVPVSGGSWVGATADCSGAVYFTATTVCTSLAKSVAITAGETLGTMTVQFQNSAGTATVVRSSNNQYSDGSTAIANTGTAATFTVTGSSSGNLPNTAIGDPESLPILIISAALISIGIVLYKLKPRYQ